MKLWDKGFETDKLIEQFTVGKDREMDIYLAEFDVLGSIAHIKMLETIGLIEKNELPLLENELKNIYHEIKEGKFEIEEGNEDVHSQVELLLTRRLGEIGKKIHSGRSRNDQVLVDLKLFNRNELKETIGLVKQLFETLLAQSGKYKNVLLPGYTHLQVAMPSSFGLWFGAYAESLVDDMLLLQAAYKINNQNPLGSAAGYGSSFPLNRQMTTDLLGFDNLNYNVVYAQMTRGKGERTISFALASVASTISRMAMDVCLYMSQNFAFINLPDELTTGSSIMPHKKNPDVFELLRAKCNKLQSVPNEILIMINNLPSGYFRDMQMIKEIFIPSFGEIQNCLHIANYMMDKLIVNHEILNDEKYKYLFSVEEVNKEAMKGLPFRDAYKKIGAAIKDGTYQPEKTVNHTHEGSIGNLCNDKIKSRMEGLLEAFDFEKTEVAIQKLLKK
jgi:argininosuccinate lyase